MFLMATQYCTGSSPWFPDMWWRKEERRGLIDPPKCLGFQARKLYLWSCLTSHPQGVWGCDGECLWRKKQLPRGLLVIRVLGSTWDQWGHGPTQRWEKDWQVSPGLAAKMGPICFTQCIPSLMVNDKLLLIPLVLLGFYQPTSFICFFWWIQTYWNG